MRHCCSFRADDIYFLKETNLFTTRKLSIGFCPICYKPIAELLQIRFDGKTEKKIETGLRANDLMLSLKDDILYSSRECNYLKFKAKPFGWKYGVNKLANIKGKERIKQYAYDFYGNSEVVKLV